MVSSVGQDVSYHAAAVTLPLSTQLRPISKFKARTIISASIILLTRYQASIASEYFDLYIQQVVQSVL